MSSEVTELERVVDEVPHGWTVQPLSKLCVEVAERVDPAAMNGDLGGHYIGLEHMGQGTGQLEGIGDAADVVSQKSRFHAGDILYGKLRPNLRKVARPELGGVCSTDIIVFRTKPTADAAFLFQFLQSEPLVAHAIATAAGTKMPRTHARSILSFEIGAPPLDEQRRIAEVLRSVDEAIAASEAVAVQARCTYQAALIDLVGNGLDHWETVCLGQIATFVNGRGFKPHEWGDAGLPIIRIQNLNGGTDFNYYSGDFNPKILVRPGDLLFAWSGSRGTSFGPHIWRGPEGVLNYHTWKVVPVAREDRDYLYFALRHLTKKIEDEAHGASALVHMQKAYVVDYEIQLPPPDERIAIAATLTDLQDAANHADQVYRAARAMKGHLLSDLLSGRVRVPA